MEVGAVWKSSNLSSSCTSFLGVLAANAVSDFFYLLSTVIDMDTPRMSIYSHACNGVLVYSG